MQIPKAPTWRMFIALLLGFFVMMLLCVKILSGFNNDLNGVQSSQDAGRERGFASRAVGCMNEIVDNDRTFSLTAACTAPQVAAYYPAEICKKYLPTQFKCGSKSANPAI